jgi:hypothetical protein
VDTRSVGRGRSVVSAFCATWSVPKPHPNTPFSLPPPLPLPLLLSLSLTRGRTIGQVREGDERKITVKEGNAKVCVCVWFLPPQPCYPAATLAPDNTRESGVRCIEEQEAEEAVRKCRGLRSSQSLGAARRMQHAACRMLRAMSTCGISCGIYHWAHEHVWYDMVHAACHEHEWCQR